jgi:signal transduction histidine kinase
MVGWADWKIQSQHRRNLQLAAATARANAANNAKSEFLANMSHELRTPLNGIIGFSEMIRDETMGPVGTPAYKDYAGHIRKAGTHLLEIINNVLDLVRIETEEMTVDTSAVDVAAVVREAVDTMAGKAAEEKVALSFEAELERMEIGSDAAKIRQIVLNLIDNGIKFTPEGGAVAAVITRAPDDGSIRIAITDTGIGMREDDVPMAMASFEQVDGSLARNFEGTGLGLPLSRKLAQLLGGDIEIDSSPGNGTAITVTLPQSVPPGALAPSRQRPAIAA